MLVFESVFIAVISFIYVNGVEETYDHGNGTLVAAVVIFRHGDRSPDFSFPNDQYFNRSYWPMGYGQLTKNGINRQYILGQWFRKRYNTFLSHIYSSDEIYVYSTNTDRTLMSASANLAGLYPPENFQVWNQQIPWQPIPVHTEKRSNDDIIVNKRKCKQFDKELRNVKHKRCKLLEKEYSEALEYIGKKSGWSRMSLDKVKLLQKNVDAYRHYNATFVPEWAEQLNQSVINYLAIASDEIPTATTKLARLRIGPFFSYLFEHFDYFINVSNHAYPKMIMFSAHESTLSSILGGMGISQRFPVGYADTIIWELTQRNDSYLVDILYKREDELERLNIKNCDSSCDYTSFKEVMSNITIGIKQWKRECKNKKLGGYETIK